LDVESAADSGRTYELSYCRVDGGRARRPLLDAAHIAFHEIGPIRRYPAHRQQPHLPGWYWFASTGQHVGYESRLELSILTLLDYDREVEAVAAQPFCLHARSRTGGWLEHVPDFFALLADRRGRVIDVTPADRRDAPQRRAKFEFTARACQLAGWDYRLESEPDATLMTNVRALAGFRREPDGHHRFAAGLLAACATPTTIGMLSEEIGPSALVRPVLFHLLWQQRVTADLTTQLTDETLVATNETSTSRA